MDPWSEGNPRTDVSCDKRHISAVDHNLVSCPRNKQVYCCDQNGPSARREEGAYLNRYVTDEQRGRRPIFIATLWAVASWLFFRVARSTRMTQIWVLRSRLEKQPTDLRQYTCLFRGQDTRRISNACVLLCHLILIFLPCLKEPKF